MEYRKPTFADVEKIYDLVNAYAGDGLMLARSRNSLYEFLRDMIIAEVDGELIGVGALHMVWDELAEIRTLAVSPKMKRSGVGKTIVNMLIEEGKLLGVNTVFTLTYQPEFFGKSY